MSEHLESVAPGIHALALRTPTLPPAEHTNCYLVGQTEISVFDPGSPWADPQGRLLETLRARIKAGARVVRIVLTHRHHDHVSGTVALQRSLEDMGMPAPIVAHPITKRWLRDDVPVDETLDDLDLLHCGDRTLRALWTPGHAPGHLAFHDEASDVVIAGDLVAAVGTIAIDPADGDLGDYLRSLERVRDLSPTMLLPSHGPPIHEARATLERYIRHRHMRSDQICEALLSRQPCAASALVPLVYPDLPPAARPLAEAQIESHLIWLTTQGRVRPQAQGYRLQGESPQPA